MPDLNWPSLPAAYALPYHKHLDEVASYNSQQHKAHVVSSADSTVDSDVSAAGLLQHQEEDSFLAAPAEQIPILSSYESETPQLHERCMLQI